MVPTAVLLWKHVLGLGDRSGVLLGFIPLSGKVLVKSECTAVPELVGRGDDLESFCLGIGVM